MKKITLLILLLTCGFVKAQNVRNVDPETFKKLTEQKGVVLLDLRTSPEIESKGKIKGATQLDFLDKNAEQKVAALDKSKTYLLYCAGGGRSGDCAELMQKLGFKDVVNLEGGIERWKKKGFEVETKTTK